MLVGTVLSAMFLARFAPAAATWLHGGHLPGWTYATFTQNWAMAQVGDYGPRWLGVTWSLAVEEQFYLTLPLLLRLVPARATPLALAAIGAAAPVCRLFEMSGSSGAFGAYVLTPCRADGLMLGVLIAWAVRHPIAGKVLAARRRWIYAIAAIALLALLDFHFGPQRYGTGYFMSLYGYSAYALLYGALVALAAIDAPGPVTRILRSRALQRAGLLAYGLYLLHLPVLGIVHGVLLGSAPHLTGARELAVTLGALAATFGLAELSWRLLEKPLMAAGHRFRYAVGQASGAGVAVQSLPRG
jgi:peptidoglycan/LPS O-acetylase OafA/YrhL